MNKITFTTADGTSITVETDAGEFTWNGQVFVFPVVDDEAYSLHIPAALGELQARRKAIEIIRTATNVSFLAAQALLSHGKPFKVVACNVAAFEHDCKAAGLSPIKA